MGTSTAVVRGKRAADRQLTIVAEEFREQRLTLGLRQRAVAEAAGMSRSKYALVEAGRLRTLSVVDVNVIASVLGLESSLRIYPGGAGIRDAGQATKLDGFLSWVRAPLRCRTEVGLPASPDRLERRAWDAMLFGGGERTAIELEMRIRDVQAMRRRHDLKRRDDPTEHFLLLIADTRSNRRVLAEFKELFADLPRLRPSAVRAALEAGRHPGTGLLLV